MASPPPDPDLVVEVFELAREGSWSYRDIVAEMRKRGRPVSLGTVSAYVKLGAQWWEDTEALNRVEERALHRGTLAWVVSETKAVYDRGDIEWPEAAGILRWALERHAKFGGLDEPTRVAVAARIEREQPTVPPGAVAAIEDLRARIAQEERKVIEA